LHYFITFTRNPRMIAIASPTEDLAGMTRGRTPSTASWPTTARGPRERHPPRFDKRYYAYLADFGIVKLAEATASFTGSAISALRGLHEPVTCKG